MKITVRANAKINCFLKITGTDERGYHLLKMRNSSVNIYDTVSVEVLKGQGLEVNFLNAFGLDEKKNTAFKAAEEFQKNFPALCFGKKFSIKVEKGIPVGAGLGGSSADAAAVFYALCVLFDIDLSKVFEIAAKVGSDVPYMIKGGNCLVEGFGEKVTELENKAFHLVVAKPYGSVSTPECYKLFDKLSAENKYGEISFDNGSFLKEFGYIPYNSLGFAAGVLNDGVVYLTELFKACSADAYFVTGSGSAVCAYFKDEAKRRECVEKLKRDEKIEFVKDAVTKESGIEVVTKE